MEISVKKPIEVLHLASAFMKHFLQGYLQMFLREQFLQGNVKAPANRETLFYVWLEIYHQRSKRLDPLM